MQIPTSWARADEVQLLCIANQRYALLPAGCKPLQAGHNDTYLVVEPDVRKAILRLAARRR